MLTLWPLLQRAEHLFECPRRKHPVSHGVDLRTISAADTSLNCLRQWAKTRRQLLEDDLNPPLGYGYVAAGKVALVLVS